MINSLAPEIQLGPHLEILLRQSVISTISELSSLKPVATPRMVGQPTVPNGDVSGIVNLTQDRVEGSLILIFPKDSIFHILAHIYQHPFSELNSSVQDGVGEFTNVIYGMLKGELNQQGYRLQMALPQVVMGQPAKVVNTHRYPTMILPFVIADRYLLHAALQVHTNG